MLNSFISSSYLRYNKGPDLNLTHPPLPQLPSVRCLVATPLFTSYKAFLKMEKSSRASILPHSLHDLWKKYLQAKQLSLSDRFYFLRY